MNHITAAKQKEDSTNKCTIFCKNERERKKSVTSKHKGLFDGTIRGIFNNSHLNIFNEYNFYRIVNGSIWGELCISVWNAPLSQPRNIIGGHLISTFIGLSIYHLFGNEYWTIALAVGMAIAVMMLTRTTHPPAGADPIVVIFRSIQLELFSNTSFSWFPCYCSYCFIH